MHACVVSSTFQKPVHTIPFNGRDFCPFQFRIPHRENGRKNRNFQKSNTDTIRLVVPRDVKAGFIGLATSKFGHSAERIINVNSFQTKHLLTNRGISKISLCSNDSLSVS